MPHQRHRRRLRRRHHKQQLIKLAGFANESIKLTQDMIVYTEKDNFDKSTMEMPYAQLGSVDVTRSCCCCYTVNEETPGFGCAKEKVERVASELHKRKVERGNIAQLGQLEHILELVTAIDARATQLRGSQASSPPPPLPHSDVVQSFEPKHYDFSDPCESFALCWATCGATGPRTVRSVNLTHEVIAPHLLTTIESSFDYLYLLLDDRTHVAIVLSLRSLARSFARSRSWR